MRKKIGIIIIIFFIIFIISLITLKKVMEKISPILMEYSKSEMKKVASTVINKSITNDILEEMDLDKLFIIDKSNQEEIITVTLDPAIINRAVSRMTDAVETSLKRIEVRDKDILKDFNLTEEYFYVPTGIAFNSVILNNIGPKIPIKIKLVGNVTSGVDTEVKEFGINNSLVSISMRVTVEIKVILPLTTDYITVSNYIPLAMKLVQGKVPIYYGEGIILGNKKESIN